MLFTSFVLLIQVAFTWIWTRRYAPILHLLRNHNVLFTKVFQSLANSGNVNISPELRADLLKFTANTTFHESDIDYEALDQIEQEYDLQIDRNVVNSGMIALVFRAKRVGRVFTSTPDSDGLNHSWTTSITETTEDTEELIVKLKRRGIDARLQADCQSLKALYSYAAWLAPRNIFVRLLKPFINNINDIASQCDFSTEIRNLRQAKEDFAPLDFIRIPTVYNKATTDPKAIVMEYINGTHTLPADTPLEKRIEYMEQFVTFMCFTYMYNTIQNTDLHSGNILFLPNGLGIIDYGMAIQLSDELHEIILTLISTIKGDRQPHEIDYIETFKHTFVPPLCKEEMDDVDAVEEICMSIGIPLFDAIDLDELNLMDNVEQLSTHIKKPIVFHPECYKIILSISMMGEKYAIMGPDYTDDKEFKEIERRGLARALSIIF
jgi:predicted unusual protein kinase regulating ubiquinone biosynthesis (AarF/ABC1/UbiB family)